MWHMNCCGRKLLQRSGKDFIIMKVLPPGVYQFRFIVDGEWRYAPDTQWVSDDLGNAYNILDVQVNILLLFFSHYACIEYLSSSMSSLEDGSPLQLYLCISLKYVQYYIRWVGPPLCSCGPKWSRMIIQWVWDQHEWAWDPLLCHLVIWLWFCNGWLRIYQK